MVDGRRPLQQVRLPRLSRSASAASAQSRQVHVSLGECTLCTTLGDMWKMHNMASDQWRPQLAWLATCPVADQICRVPLSLFGSIFSLLN
jgi:hypothetical protein